MTAIKITARFATVLEALNASGMDISYNPQVALDRAKDLGRENRYGKAKEAFLCEDGALRYLYECNDGLTVLNTFEPFHSCLSDSPFHAVCIAQETIFIFPSPISKSKRKEIAKLNLIVA